MFLSDQGRDAIIMKRIMTGEHFPAIGAPSSIGQIYLGPFYYYLIAPFLLLFNFNPIGMSFGASILSIIGLIIIYIILKKEFNDTVGIIFLLLTTFSSINIEMSRFSWNPNLLPYFSFFTLYLFYKMVQKQKIIYSILFGIFFGLSLQLHYLAALLILPIIFYYLVTVIPNLFRDPNQILKRVQNDIFSIISFIIVSLPLLIFDLRHDFINSNNFLKFFTQGGITQQSALYLRIIEVVQNGINYAFSINVSFIIIVFLIILLFFWILLLKKTKSSCLFVLNIANICLFFFGFSLLNSLRLPHYYGQIYISIYLVMAYLLSNLKEYLPKYWKVLISAFFIGFIIINFQKYNFLYKPGSNQISHSQKVAEFLAPKIGSKPFNIATWPVELTEDNYSYFLEIKGLVPADRTKVEITDQMFVLCNKKPCRILDSPSWNISMFGPAKIDKIWEVEEITIYKLIHNNLESRIQNLERNSEF